MAEDRYQQIKKGSIRERLAFLAQDSVLYGGAMALSRLLSLLILPVLTRLFSSAEFGALDVMAGLGAVSIAFIIMGQDSAIARFYYEHEDETERRQIVSQALLTLVVLCSGVSVTVWFAAEPILHGLYGIEAYLDEFRMLVASFPFVVLVRFSSNLLKWTFARYRFVAVALGASAGIILCTLFNVVVLEMGVKGVFLGQVMGNALFAVLGVWFCRKHLTIPKGFAFGRLMLAFGFPYMVVGVATCLIPTIDRWFITRDLGLESTGFYAIGYRYAFLLMLPINAFQSAWTPFALSIYKEESAEATYNRVLILATVTLAAIALAMVAVAEPVIELVASARYLPGSVVVLPLTFALAIEAVSWIMGIGIDLSKRTQFSMFSYFIGVMAAVFWIWLFIGPFGIVGVGWGLLLGKLTQTIAYVGFAYMLWPLRYRWHRPAGVLAVAIGTGFAMETIPLDSPVGGVAARLACGLVFAALTWFLLLTGYERDQARILIRSRLSRGARRSEDQQG